MIIFNTFIILLFGFIFEIVVTRYPLTTFSAGLTGFFHCKFRKVGYARVMISDKPNKIFERKPVAESFVKFDRPFYLKGRVKGIFKPCFYLKIIHNCVKAKIIQQKVYVKRIPSRYIARNGQNFYFFNIGYPELSHLEGRAE
uniref:Transthyretin-like family protein n=1 Tax=Strongyloides venezuelensis TaxID=75913 RepID=A0A0K0FR14_STRVS